MIDSTSIRMLFGSHSLFAALDTKLVIDQLSDGIAIPTPSHQKRKHNLRDDYAMLPLLWMIYDEQTKTEQNGSDREQESNRHCPLNRRPGHCN
jgi:hypothetical protein